MLHEDREIVREVAAKKRWLLRHAQHYLQTCPICGASPGTLCRDQEDGEEVYFAHRERLPEGVAFRLRSRRTRKVREEAPCSGGS
mgnify:CR=1 FL=1